MTSNTRTLDLFTELLIDDRVDRVINSIKYTWVFHGIFYPTEAWLINVADYFGVLVETVMEKYELEYQLHCWREIEKQYGRGPSARCGSEAL